MSPAATLQRPLSLRNNFLWTLAGNGIYAASQWIVIIFIAKLGSPEMLGQYALAVAVVTPVTMLSSLNLRSVLVTDVSHSDCFEDYLSVRLVTSMLTMLVLVGIVLAGHFSRVVVAVIFTLAVGQVSEWVSDIYYGMYQRSEQMDRIARSMSSRAILSVALLGLALWWTRNILWAMAGLTLGRLVTTVGWDINVPICRKTLLSGTRWASRGSVAFAALPLGIALWLNSLNSNIPRYFIESHAGLRDLGIFSAIASIVTIGGTIVNALGQSATPRLAKLFVSGDGTAFKRLIAKLLGMIIVIGLAGIAVASLAGAFVLKTMFRPEYAQSGGLLTQMMIAGMLVYLSMILGYTHTAARYFRVQIPLLAAGTISVLLSSRYLIPSRGLEGAVLSISISALVVLLGELVVLHWIFADLRYRTYRAQA